MSLQIIDPTTYPGWDDLLLSTPGSSFFHTSAWAQVLSESYGYTPLYFTIIENGKLRALVPLMEVNSILTGKRGVSLPFTDFCEPILDEDISFPNLFNEITEFGKSRGWKHVELRGGLSLLPESESKPFKSYLGHTLDLSGGQEKIFKNFRKGTKSAVKQAQKEDLEIKIGVLDKFVEEFYHLNCMTRKLHKLPPQPFIFFGGVQKNILEKGLGVIILILYKGMSIAGAVFFHFGNKAFYKYGASMREYQDLRANNLIIWNAIQYFSNKGCKSLCFGRTDLENEGLRIFKNGWGAEEREIKYLRYDLSRSIFVKENKHKKISYVQDLVFGNMPIPLLKMIGSLAYKHMG